MSGKQSKLCQGNNHTTKKKKKKNGGLLLYPPSPTSKDGVLVVYPPFYQTLKLRKIFKLPWIVSLAMQASCKRNINDSFQILRPINFVHAVHQIGGVLYNPPPPPPTTKHGGSSLSTIVMTTSLVQCTFIFIICTLHMKKEKCTV